jgi:hypothetical protein
MTGRKKATMNEEGGGWERDKKMKKENGVWQDGGEK